MFKITAEIMGAKPREVLRHDDFSVDIPAILDNIIPESRMIFLCSPNNPTANATPREDIILLLEQAQCMVLIDEAYSEFYGKSIVDLTHEFENLTGPVVTPSGTMILILVLFQFDAILPDNIKESKYTVPAPQSVGWIINFTLLTALKS